MEEIKKDVEELEEIIKDMWMIVRLKEEIGEGISTKEVKEYLEDLTYFVRVILKKLTEKGNKI